MALTIEDVQKNLGRTIMSVWDLEKSLGEATERATKAEARVAELEKSHEAE